MKPLAHPLAADESAGYHLQRSVPSASLGATCGEVLAMLQQERFEFSDIVVIVDDSRRVRGIISAGTVASQKSEKLVADIMLGNVAVASIDADQERVASLAIGNPLGCVVVLDDSERFIGLIPPQALLAVLRHEHIEDLHRLAGILHENRSAIAAIEGPSFSRARHRLPWLLVGLVGSALATLIMSSFETMLQARVAIAFFLPGIVYIADAMGTQTEAIAVRGLSLSHASIRDLLARELWTGVLIGAVLGTVAAAAVWLILGDRSLALAIGVAICSAGVIATAIGLLLPWAFQRLGFDPAYGSGPLATVIQDLLSLLVYFGCLAAFSPTAS